jgi:hypothetical protein
MGNQAQRMSHRARNVLGQKQPCALLLEAASACKKFEERDAPALRILEHHTLENMHKSIKHSLKLQGHLNSILMEMSGTPV